MSEKSEKKNYHALRYGTAEGELQFGHIHDDNEMSSVMLRNGNAFDHYITLEATGKPHRKNGTICNSPGAFQVKAGKELDKDDDFGMYFDAENGDIVIRASKGRIRMEAQDIWLNAKGPDGETGNVVIDANEKFIVAAQIVDVSSKASSKFFSEKTVEVIGNQLLNIYGGLIDAADGATKKRGSKTPSTNEEQARQLGQQ
jgi:hypothetical protein